MSGSAENRTSFEFYGHRGSPRLFPENRIDGFRKALDDGLDGFETDVRLTRDGHPVLHHDAEREGVPLESLSLSQLGGEVTLLEKLGDLASRAAIILEIKDPRAAETVLEITRSWHRVTISSFDHRMIARLARRGTAHRLGLVFSAALLDGGEYAKEAGASVVFPDSDWIDEAFVADCRAFAIDVIPWTVNDPRLLDRVRRIGCAGVITDETEEVTRWRNRV